MSALHAVPDPDDEPGEELADDEDQEEEPDEAGEEAVPGRAFTMPDLRPYLDPRGAAVDMAQLGIDVGRRPARAAGRGLVSLLRRFPTGSGVLLSLLVGWLNGTRGKRDGSAAYRLGGVLLVGYGVVRAIGLWPVRSLLGLAVAWVLGAALAERWAAAEAERRRQGGKAKGKSTGKVKRRDADEETPADDAGEDEEDALAEAQEEPPLTALIRAQIGDENGVHLQDLRPAMRTRLPGLQNATDEQLRQHLVAAGFNPSRKFRARGVAGRQGVHRKDLPALPSPEGGPEMVSAPVSGRGDRRRPANSPKAESSGERDGEGTEQEYSIVPDPERGPSAWRIEHHK